MPRLKLVDLLRRRKMTLLELLNSFGITTYSGLSNHCARIGVVTPTEDEFKIAFPFPVSNPQDGVIVLEALPAPDGDVEQSDDPEPDQEQSLGTLEGPTKKQRRKKDTTQG